MLEQFRKNVTRFCEIALKYLMLKKPILFLVIFLMIFFIVGGFWQPYDIEAINIAQRHMAPTKFHWLGTDHLGRDLLSRIMAAGWRTACVIFFVAAIGFTIGTLLGTIACLVSPSCEAAILRCCEFFILIPTLIVALTATAVFGLSPISAGLALGLSGIGPHALFAHALVKRLLAQPFILAAFSLGVSKTRVLLHHILPNIMPATLVHTANQAGFAVVAYASLAFIGLGSNGATPDWGSMLFEYRIFIFDHPALLFWPGLAVGATVIILNSAVRRI